MSQFRVVTLTMQKLILCFFLCLATLFSVAQEKENVQTLSAGIEFRPIFPIDFLNTGSQQVSNNNFSVGIAPKFSFSAGMIIRYGFHKRFALETGLNFVQRNYDLNVSRDSVPALGTNPASAAFSSATNFTVIGYEHPIKLLFFVQVADAIFLNAAAGLQFTFFPSDIYTTNEDKSNELQSFEHYGARLGFAGKTGSDGFIHGGGIMNLGMEYRTKKAGYFYLGGTYHIPFADVYRSRIQYRDESNPVPNDERVQELFLNGSYLTFDVRYFFHSKPLVKKDKKKKKNRKSDSAD